MAKKGGEWIVLSRQLLEDLIDLYDAELAALRVEVTETGRRLLKILALAGAAFFTLFWILALVAYSLVEVVALWLPRWGAALAVTGIFVLLAAILGLIGWLYARRLTNPIDSVFDRLRDHLAFWRTEVALYGDGRGAGDGPEAGDGGEVAS